MFGALNTAMPNYVYTVFLVSIAALAVTAVLGARTLRQALVVFLVFAGCVTAPIVIAAAVLRQNGFDVQARHVLPLLMALPVISGVVLDRRFGAVAKVAAVVVGLGMASVQFAAWAMNTAVYKQGPNGVFPERVWGRLMFDRAFDRPGWAIVAMAGAAVLALAPVAAMREAEA